MHLVTQHLARRNNLEGRHVWIRKKSYHQVKIFAVKTTTGQERNVARLIASKVEMTHIPIKALLVPDTLKGYVFIEADGPHLVEEAITGVRHVRSRIPGLNQLQRNRTLHSSQTSHGRPQRR